MSDSAARKLCGGLLDSRLAQTEADLRRLADLIASERRRIPSLHNGELGGSAGHLVGRVLHEMTTVLASNMSGLASAAGDFDTVVSRHETELPGGER